MSDDSGQNLRPTALACAPGVPEPQAARASEASLATSLEALREVVSPREVRAVRAPGPLGSEAPPRPRCVQRATIGSAGPVACRRRRGPRATLAAGLAGLSALFALLAALWTPLSAQTPPALERERSEFTNWLGASSLSPFAILALQPVGGGISIGAEPADIPLPLTTRGEIHEVRGALTLSWRGETRPLPRGRPVRLEQFTLVASGSPARSVIAAFGPVHGYHPPGFFPYSASLALTVTLEPPERRGSFRALGADGVEAEAREAGFVQVAAPGAARLRVYRLGATDDDEAEFAIFFRDGTSGHGSYPAGRFVSLEPLGGGRFSLDFNRARNPFCAYSSVYPCPAPWPGNSIPARVEAGERYTEATP